MLLLPLVAACGPNVQVPVITSDAVNRAVVFERATDNLLAALGDSQAVNVTPQTAPCIATAMTSQEQYALAVQPASIAPLLPQILGRPTAQFCMGGGAL